MAYTHHCSIEDEDPFPPRIDCPRAEEGCSCQLCPEELALDTHSRPFWYPDEPICNRRDYQRIPWIRNQKRIARAATLFDRYFTVEMLQAVTQVRRGIAGVSPDQPVTQAREAEAAWIADRQRSRVARERNKSPP